MKAWTAAFLLCMTFTNVPVTRTIDGDTFVAAIEIAPDLTWAAKVRVLGVNAPEMHGPDAAKAVTAKLFAESWLNKGPVTISGCHNDAFGRFLGRVTRDNEDLTDLLIKNGLGVPR